VDRKGDGRTHPTIFACRSPGAHDRAGRRTRSRRLSYD
jgi:hypothetical protein